MRRLILGTAGHIDHGKTELVRALTGVDTDRLKEEKERGITIDLGFAELPGEDLRLGVVDVPGHEGFIRNMLAGATGMDVVLLVVAADEGVMPQTREHLAIVTLLGVRRLVVAVTKADLVEEAWLELVRDDVRDALAGGPFAEAPLAVTSARTGQGLDGLRDLLLETAGDSPDHDPDDLVFLPLDRVFTVRGTGTVVTGTFWSGRLRVGASVRLLPEGLEGRVRGLQVHEREVEAAEAGERTAVALTGEGIDREGVQRGQALVTHGSWPASHMLTVRFTLLPDTDWELAHNQRVRVHLGTAEVMARCVLFGEAPLRAGDAGWGQLRLEAPVAARARQRAVIRSYSPVTTLGGAVVAEPVPPKRRDAGAETLADLGRILEGEPVAALEAVLSRAGEGGVEQDLLPVVTGLPPRVLREAVREAVEGGALATPQGRLVGVGPVGRMRDAVTAAVEAVHRDEPYRPGLPLEEARAAVPDGAAPGATDTLLERLQSEGVLVVEGGAVARRGFEPVVTAAQEALRERVAELYLDAGLTPPAVDDLPGEVTGDPAFWTLLRGLEREGRLVALDATGGLWIDAGALEAAVERVRETLGGRDDLGPADFKDAVPVSRKHLLPILAHLDRRGVTVRCPGGRSVPAS